MRQCEAAVHLAAFGSVPDCERAPAKAYETNLCGTYMVASTAHMYGVKLVFASSFAVIHPENRSSVYGLTKALGEKLVSFYGGVSCRLSNVYGGMKFAELKKSVVARLMTGSFEERGDDGQVRDFIHVDDVCRILYKAMVDGKPGSVIEAHTGVETSIGELKKLSEDPSFPDNLRHPPMDINGQ